MYGLHGNILLNDEMQYLARNVECYVCFKMCLCVYIMCVWYRKDATHSVLVVSVCWVYRPDISEI